MNFVLNHAYTNISTDHAHVMSFDREGRMMGFFREGLTHRRSLASRVNLRWRERTERQRRWLSPEETKQLFGDMYRMVDGLRKKTDGELRRRIEGEILRWSPASLLDEDNRFHAVYTPIPILPPDQYRSVVLQATEGCTWNRCTFCNFYQGQQFRMRPLELFEEHIQGVREFLGKNLRLRRGVFVGDGNALAVKPARLLNYIHLIRKYFPDDPLYGFVDVFTGERHTVDEWRSLARLGLHRVYIGMETGYDPLLEFLNKPGSQEETVSLVREMKEAGLAVSLIIMVGIGGHHYRASHRDATIEALSRMPLGDGDIVYLSPFIEHTGSTYSLRREEEGIVSMNEREVAEEYKAMIGPIRRLGVKASRYDIRDFIY